MMVQELVLNKVNRLRIADAFRRVPRVDFSIQCVIEDQMGQAFADDRVQPTVFQLQIGPFHYYSGPTESAAAQQLIAAIPAYNLLMPSGDGWGELARRQFGKALHSQERTSFSTADLAEEHLTGLLAVNPHQEKIVPLDAELAASLSAAPEGYFNLSDFASPADFALRGLGFTFLSAGEPAGVAYSSLVCSQGIEVSIYVTKPHRRRGVATALGSRLLLACLEKQLRPNWDAANLESVRLAEKLGYRRRGSYDAFYRLEK